jgi:hypothetical protein
MQTDTSSSASGQVRGWLGGCAVALSGEVHDGRGAQRLRGYRPRPPRDRRFAVGDRSTGKVGEAGRAPVPRLLRQSEYNERVKAVAPLMEATLRWLADHTPGSAEMLRLMDATPVPCGQSAVTAKRSDLSDGPGTATALAIRAGTGAPS